MLMGLHPQATSSFVDQVPRFLNFPPSSMSHTVNSFVLRRGLSKSYTPGKAHQFQIPLNVTVESLSDSVMAFAQENQYMSVGEDIRVSAYQVQQQRALIELLQSRLHVARCPRAWSRRKIWRAVGQQWANSKRSLLNPAEVWTLHRVPHWAFFSSLVRYFSYHKIIRWICSLCLQIQSCCFIMRRFRKMAHPTGTSTQDAFPGPHCVQQRPFKSTRRLTLRTGGLMCISRLCGRYGQVWFLCTCS